MKVMIGTPQNELAQAFGNGGSVEYLLGQLLTSAPDTALDEPQLLQDPCANVSPDCPWLASNFDEVELQTASAQ